MERALDIMSDLPVTVDPITINDAFTSCVRLARSEGLSAYDAAYLALANRHAIPLATQDEKLRSAADRIGVMRFEGGQEPSG